MNVNDFNIHIIIEHDSLQTTPKKYALKTNFIKAGGAACCQVVNP